MSNSKLADIKVPALSSNYTKGRDYKISKITIHHMAGKLTAKQCGKVFQTKGRNASAHYGVGSDGKIGLYVDEKNAAWADGNRTSNHKSVTIETANSSTGGDWPVSDKTLKLLIKLVADIAKRNNLGKLIVGKNLTWHSMYAATACPGTYLKSKMQYIADEANKINSKSTTTEKKTTVDSAKSYLKSLAGTYKVTAKDGLNVRSGAGTTKKKLATIPKGTEVKSYGYYTSKAGTKWLLVQFTYKGTTYTGFCSKKYLEKV